ncbi:hypothetical protein PHYSODRAFT_287043 [Phytophthora sojae]|uniref:CCHC-type domain-containing protein n=1 Tax=Phytophthora sojae (strain P6497) TaxID=1094619 RepID=G4ZZZ8_PHYSP|nr:hypothetical protein PHYSODRAFT_287043 [Phytophthora sojae]EGZ10440.1 hypothetical protein PHYSODRAFT_287043 [Phytophthora sojae]|eukprot:XP_009533185.1 hypothetical protein PHYSODRAFT_287043 [Phytophthora sojae]
MANGQCPVDMAKVLYGLQAASSPEEYKLTHPNTADYIEGIDPSKWVLYPALRTNRLYGWRTTNFVESQNAAALAPRLLLPFGFFSFFMKQIMDSEYKHQQLAAEWIKKEVSLTHRLHTKIQKQQELSLQRLRPTRIPCRHYIVALHHVNRSSEMFDVVDDCFKLDSFQVLHGSNAQGPIELVLDEELAVNKDDLLAVNKDDLPPKLNQNPGRNKQRRYPSSGDTTQSVGRAKRKMTCTKCNRQGHNKRTCGK